MASITLHHINGDQDQRVQVAWTDLAHAFRQLVSALLASLSTPHAPKKLSVYEEAEELQEMADRLAQRDPQFAQNLYAAADRHEWTAESI